MEKIASTTTTQAEPAFPSIAIVGQQRLQLALILTVLSPEIGSVVIRSRKGTARITTVRTLAPLLSGSLMNLPLDTTEDRVIGSTDVETILTTGHVQFNPKLFNAVDGGTLYVDKISLLSGHLIDSILDIATTGRVVARRDGISHSATSKFMLIGTTNPEGDELRSQFPDRFGLTTGVTAPKNPAVHAEIVTCRPDFGTDPESLVTWFAAGGVALHTRIGRARTLLDNAELAPSILGQTATMHAAFDVDGVRADIVITYIARTHTTWWVARDESAQSRSCNPIEVTMEDIKVAAEMILPHRRRRNPFDKPGLGQEQPSDVLQDAEGQFRDDQDQPESSSETSNQPEIKSEPVSQFDSGSGSQEP